MTVFRALRVWERSPPPSWQRMMLFSLPFSMARRMWPTPGRAQSRGRRPSRWAACRARRRVPGRSSTTRAGGAEELRDDAGDVRDPVVRLDDLLADLLLRHVRDGDGVRLGVVADLVVASAMRRVSFGNSFTCSPMMKNVAWTSCSASRSSIFGVHVGFGPSSMVRAIEFGGVSGASSESSRTGLSRAMSLPGVHDAARGVGVGVGVGVGWITGLARGVAAGEATAEEPPEGRAASAPSAVIPAAAPSSQSALRRDVPPDSSTSTSPTLSRF